MTFLTDDLRHTSPWLLMLLCAGFIMLLSSIPQHEWMNPFHAIQHSDKLEHAATYAVLTWACHRAFRSSSRAPLARYAGALSILFGLGLGLGCEWYQSFLPTRSVDGWDVLANSCGSFFAICAIAGLRQPNNKHT